MQTLPKSGSRITSQLRSTNNPLVQRFLGGVPPAPPSLSQVDTVNNLTLLENILTEVESSAQVVPQVIAQATDTLNIPAATSASRQGGAPLTLHQRMLRR